MTRRTGSEERAEGATWLRRASGVLLHPTALPSPYGIGDLGKAAYRFIDFLRESAQGFWQILPLGPVGDTGSPYTSPSAFAGNPLLIAPDRLVAEGLLTPDDLADVPPFPATRVDFPAVAEYKLDLIRRARDRFGRVATPAQRAEFEDFCERHRGWLDDYALFQALRATFGQAAWTDWPAGLAARRARALERARRELADEIALRRMAQFFFFRQWGDLRSAARDAGIQIVGDLPIFIAHDSVDVWTNRRLFKLDPAGRPTVVAGVPPDAFAATGQLWGNPIYRWNASARTDHAWWAARLRAVLELVDVIRIDHFRGFEAGWEVPESAETAESGRWVSGPGRALFDSLARAFGPLPIIVEDLGLITPEVIDLREQLGYPGMKVLQFAFDSGPNNPYLPHNYPRHCVAYSGTHDNDTTIGWFASLPEEIRRNVLDYTGTEGKEIHWDLIRLVQASVADLAIVPLQDILGLGSEARFNKPGEGKGQWAWRFTWDQVTSDHAHRLAHLTRIYGRAL